MHLLGGIPGAALRTSGEPPLLQVTGEGRAQAAPDKVEISLGFTARAPQAAEAFNQVSQAINRVVAALLQAGVQREQLQTEQISLTPVFDEQQRLTGYEATSILRVTLRNVSAAGTIIDRAVSAGANRVQEIRFDLTDPAPLAAAALERAVQDANRQAAVLARSLGVRLGPVFRVVAEPAGGPIVPVFARAAAAEVIPVLPGNITITRTIRVDYVISSM